jgi:hypothetical protein
MDRTLITKNDLFQFLNDRIAQNGCRNFIIPEQAIYLLKRHDAAGCNWDVCFFLLKDHEKKPDEESIQELTRIVSNSKARYNLKRTENPSRKP